MTPYCSVIVPIYNEVDNIAAFYSELIKYVPERFELIWINDGSNDGSLQQIKKIAAADQRVRCISFSRNFGQQAALMAGLHYARGERIVLMDGDLQHPPELLPAFFGKLDEGFDLVSGKKIATADIRQSKKSFTKLFYSLLNMISETRIEPDVSDFRAFNRKIADALVKFEERELFLRGVFNWIGFKTTTIDFVAPERHAGETKYSFGKMIQLGLKGTLSFSFKPLRLSLLIGTIVSLASFCYIIYAIVVYFKGHTIPGWPSLIIGVMFLGGIQLIMIGLIGEYIASFFNEIKKRPLFLIDETINC